MGILAGTVCNLHCPLTLGPFPVRQTYLYVVRQLASCLHHQLQTLQVKLHHRPCSSYYDSYLKTQLFLYTARHIAGLDNSIADSLSHFHMDRFCHLAPNASPSPASSLHQRHQFNSFCLFLLGVSLAPATKHSYNVGQNHFISFCLMQGLISPSTPLLLTSEITLI